MPNGQICLITIAVNKAIAHRISDGKVYSDSETQALLERDKDEVILFVLEHVDTSRYPDDVRWAIDMAVTKLRAGLN